MNNNDLQSNEQRQPDLHKASVSRRPLFDIVDKAGSILPRHYSGRARTFEEATKLLEGLNRDGEYRPYKMIPADGG